MDDLRAINQDVHDSDQTSPPLPEKPPAEGRALMTVLTAALIACWVLAVGGLTWQMRDDLSGHSPVGGVLMTIAMVLMPLTLACAVGKEPTGHGGWLTGLGIVLGIVFAIELHKSIAAAPWSWVAAFALTAMLATGPIMLGLEVRHRTRARS